MVFISCGSECSGVIDEFGQAKLLNADLDVFLKIVSLVIVGNHPKMDLANYITCGPRHFLLQHPVTCMVNAF